MNQIILLPHSILMFAGSFLGLLAIIITWPKRNGIGGKPFIVFLAATVQYTFSASIEAAVVGTADKIFWSKMEYVGLTLIPVLLFLFTVYYCQKTEWITPLRVALLSVIPALTLVLVWTNDLHHLYWPYFLAGSFEYNVILYGHGFFFYLFEAYLYLICLASALLLYIFLPRVHNASRKQAFIIIASMALPALGGLIYIFNLNPIPGVDWSPAGLTVSGLVLTWGIRRLGLFDLAPLAREKVFDLFQHAIVVVDHHGLIVDLNPLAQRLFGVNKHKIGQPYTSVPLLEELFTQVKVNPCVDETQPAFHFEGILQFVAIEDRFFHVTVSPLLENGKVFQGYLVFIEDETELHHAWEAERIQREYLQMLIKVAPFRVAYLNLAGEFLLVNHNYAEFFGMTEDQFLGKNYQEVLPREYIQTISPAVGANMQGKVVVEAQKMANYKGETRMSKVTYTPFFTSDHKVHSIGMYAQDTTEEWEKENHLIASQQKLESELQTRTQDLKSLISELENEIQLKETARAALHHMEETLVERVASQSKKLAGLYEVILAGSQAEEPNQLLENVLDQVLMAIDAQGASIHKVENDQLRLVAQHKLPRAMLANVSLFDSAWLDRLEMPMLVQEIRLDENLPQGIATSGFGALMGASIRQRNQPPALLCIFWDSAHEFSIEDISLVSAIAEELAVILENIDLRQRMESAITLKERRRLARDLHDSVTQSLHSLVLATYAANNRLQQGNMDKLQISLTQISEGAEQALKEMRLLLYEMRLVPLQDVDLVKAIQTRLEMVEGRAGIQASLSIGENTIWPKAWESDLFCIITEALNNSLKYAQASKIEVKVNGDPNDFLVDICDNGIGFNLNQGSNGGMGLKTMAERAERLGGEMVIDANCGSGTRIIFQKN